jgi:hypothetical protein
MGPRDLEIDGFGNKFARDFEHEWIPRASSNDHWGSDFALHHCVVGPQRDRAHCRWLASQIQEVESEKLMAFKAGRRLRSGQKTRAQFHESLVRDGCNRSECCLTRPTDLIADRANRPGEPLADAQ